MDFDNNETWLNSDCQMNLYLSTVTPQSGRVDHRVEGEEYAYLLCKVYHLSNGLEVLVVILNLVG